MIEKPKNLEPTFYYTPYIQAAEGKGLIESLWMSKSELAFLIDGLDDQMSNFKYAEGKWTIKQVLQHVCDCERIFSYRALRFSRRDKTVLPGFEENDYAQNDNSETLDLRDIKDEFIAVRQASITLFKYMDPESLDFLGNANGLELTPRALGWIISGHTIHHCKIIKERYLSLT